MSQGFRGRRLGGRGQNRLFVQNWRPKNRKRFGQSVENRILYQMAAFLVSGSTYEPRFTVVNGWCRGVPAREMSTGSQGRESPTGITFRNLKQEGTAMSHRCMKRAHQALQIGRNSYRFGFCFGEISVPETSDDGGTVRRSRSPGHGNIQDRRWGSGASLQTGSGSEERARLALRIEPTRSRSGRV